VTAPRCSRCGRRLRSEASIKAGIGPECSSKPTHGSRPRVYCAIGQAVEVAGHTFARTPEGWEFDGKPTPSGWVEKYFPNIAS